MDKPDSIEKDKIIKELKSIESIVEYNEAAIEELEYKLSDLRCETSHLYQVSSELREEFDKIIARGL